MIPLHISTPKTNYRDKYQKITKVEADFGDFIKEYYIRDAGGRSGIVIKENESVLLVKQYRILIRDFSWEIPGGKVDTGELPMLSARRECFEETGVDCYDLKPLVFYHVGLDTSYNPTHIFYTDKFSQLKPFEPDPKEVIEMKWVPIDECLELISKKEIVDSFTIIALLSFNSFRDKLNLLD